MSKPIVGEAPDSMVANYMDRLEAENAAMRKLLQRVADHFDGTDAPLGADALAILEHAPCQFCGEPIPFHDPDCGAMHG